MLRLRNRIAGAGRGTTSVVVVTVHALPWTMTARAVSELAAISEHGLGSNAPLGSLPVSRSAAGSHGGAVSGIRPTWVGWVGAAGSVMHLPSASAMIGCR